MNRYKLHKPTIYIGQKWRDKEDGEIIEIYDTSFLGNCWEILTPSHRTLITSSMLKQDYEEIYE